MKKRIQTFFTLLLTLCLLVFSATACGNTSGVFKFSDEFLIEERNVTIQVGSETSTLYFPDKITVSGNASYKVYSDLECTKEIVGKEVSLNYGNNLYYILATVNGKDTLYHVIINRKGFSAGRIDIDADIGALKLYSMGRYMGDGATSFENLGYASFSNKVLNIENMAPGDKAEFDVNLTNNSNIAVKYRIVLTNLSDDPKYIQYVKIKINNVEIDSANYMATDWSLFENAAVTIPVSIELPIEAGNESQENKIKLSVIVEVVQANAEVK